MNRRALAAVLAATLAASAWLALQDEPAPEAPVVRAAPRAATPRRAAEPLPAWPAPPAPRPATPWQAEPARLAAWMPPPPAPVAAPRSAAPAASAAPVAPAFPYPLIGRIQDGDSTHALFATPQRTLPAKPQDLIDGQWRVEEVGPAGVVLTWLPGQLRQTLVFRPS